MSKTNVTAAEICAQLDAKHCDPQKSMIAFEVANGTGGASTRRADAVSMGFWPSNGMEIVGYEIKVSRADWLNEIKQPEKSQSISQFCDRWYLVAPQGVLGIDELPKGWGYIQATQKSLRTKVKAPKRDTITPDIFFQASLLRSVTKKYSNEGILKAKIERIRKDVERDLGYETDRLKKEIKRYETILTTFKNKTGVNIASWGYERTIDAIAGLQTVDIEQTIRKLEIETGKRDELNSQATKTIHALRGFKDYQTQERVSE